MNDRYQPLRDAVATSSMPVGPTAFPRILELLGDLLKERDALLAIHSDTLQAVRNDTLETAALICDARERRAETDQAQARYRLMAKDIRALKRAVLADGEEA